MRLASLESGWVVGIWEFFGWNFEFQLSGKNSCPNECGHVFGSDFRWIFCRCSSRMLRHDFRWDSESEVELRPELGICSRSLGNKIQDGEMYVMIVSSYLHMCVHIYIYIYISKDLYIYRQYFSLVCLAGKSEWNVWKQRGNILILIHTC